MNRTPIPEPRKEPGPRLRAAKSIEPACIIFAGGCWSDRGICGATMWDSCMDFVHWLWDFPCKKASEFRNIKLYKVKQSDRSSPSTETHPHTAANHPNLIPYTLPIQSHYNPPLSYIQFEVQNPTFAWLLEAPWALFDFQHCDMLMVDWEEVKLTSFLIFADNLFDGTSFGFVDLLNICLATLASTKAARGIHRALETVILPAEDVISVLTISGVVTCAQDKWLSSCRPVCLIVELGGIPDYFVHELRDADRVSGWACSSQCKEVRWVADWICDVILVIRRVEIDTIPAARFLLVVVSMSLR